jgi:2-amino-4-hydroxy-6-hydroxymethyldihydropteridine diphosphokinase
MNRVVIALGSNIDPDVNVKKACDALAAEFTVCAVSSFLTTAPLGVKNQADFLNGVVCLETGLELEPLKKRLKEIEAALGRQPRENKWGPREIDLDVLIWNGQVVNKDYYERDFLQKAVAEILPGIKLRCC